jgi:hypothetical protein
MNEGERKYRLFILKNDQGKQLNVPIPLWFCPTLETKITAIGITEMVKDMEPDCHFEEQK